MKRMNARYENKNIFIKKKSCLLSFFSNILFIFSTVQHINLRRDYFKDGHFFMQFNTLKVRFIMWLLLFQIAFSCNFKEQYLMTFNAT